MIKYRHHWFNSHKLVSRINFKYSKFIAEILSLIYAFKMDVSDNQNRFLLAWWFKLLFVKLKFILTNYKEVSERIYPSPNEEIWKIHQKAASILSFLS